MPKDSPRAFERQPKESSPAWKARKTYHYMGPTRSIARVGQDLGKSRALLEGWSSRWSWVASARDYDAYSDDLARKGVIEGQAIRLQANLDKFARWEESYLDMLWNTFTCAFNDLFEAVKSAKAADRPVPFRQKATLIRNVARTAPLAERAIAIGRARAGAALGPGQVVKPAGHVPGRSLAVLRAYNEFVEPEETRDPEEPTP